MTAPEDPTPTEPTSPVDDVIDAEIVSPPAAPSTPPLPDPDYSEAGVPSFDFVRDKIENRIATAIGSQELAESTPEGQQVDEMMRERDEAAKKRLEEIRRSMGSSGT
ncbi:MULTISPECIES: PspA domain-containing protein [unclassified Gordonia (in: high G+C Gram-positive bacteria)]|uniref:PspA domain-containing protein n=1 Tax=Gordonia sp. VNQ95 TaxID=3156619 RepID=UPI0032B41CC5